MNTQKPDNSPAAFIGVKPEPAGFWIRLSAFIIDFTCVWIPCIWLAFTLERYLISKHIVTWRDGICFFMALFSTFFYQALTIGRWGQTLGKFLAGISVVAKNGEKLSYSRSFGRTLAWYLVMFLLLFSLTVFLPTCGAGSPFTVFMLAFECLLGTILQHKIFVYDPMCRTMVIYKKPIGPLRKTIVILFGVIVLIVISYHTARDHGTPEKARVAEAMSAFSSVKSGQERYLARSGVYAEEFTSLDINYSGMTAAELPMKFYKVSMSTSGCGKKPCYVVTATRHVNNGTVAARYGLYSLKAIIPDRPRVQIASCPGGGTNCAELLQ